MRPDPTEWAFDPLDPAFVADPYPFFDRLRSHEPVHRSPMGSWVLTRHADVRSALEDPRLGNAPARHAVVNARNRDRYPCADVAANVLPFLDPPEHAAPRLAVGRAFHDRLRAAPPAVAEIADHLLDDWEAGEVRDVVSDFASPLAFLTMAELMGLPTEEAPRLTEWSEHFFRLLTGIPSTEAREALDLALTEFRSFLHEIVAERRGRPSDDLISALLRSVGQQLTRAQLVDNCMLLFADGLENVDRAVGNAAYSLLRRPDQLRTLLARPELTSSAVGESLRFESPAQYIARVALEDVPIGDVTIPAGSAVLLALGSANRDPEAFPDPNVLDIERRPNPHLAFGRGRHGCIGGALVEMQMEVALGRLFGRYPRLSLASEDIRFMTRPGHRWVEAVPVHPGTSTGTGRAAPAG